MYKGCEKMIFRIKKIYICISWYFFIMLGWVVITNKIEKFLLCLSALIIHEIGHIMMIKILKEKITMFHVLPFGFCCRLKNQNKVRTENMIKILLAGPATSLLVAGLFLWTKNFSIANFIIGLLNLLPIWNLDGGKAVKIIANR